MVTVYISGSYSIRLTEGDSYIINKPSDIDEFPGWNESFMDVLDGKECHVVENQGDRTRCCVDIADFPRDGHGNMRAYCYLRPSWLSKVEIEVEELEENDFDIEELF